jgi:hypothetical protein
VFGSTIDAEFFTKQQFTRQVEDGPR